MISASDEYKAIAASGATPRVRGTLTLADGTVRQLTGDDFMSGGTSFEQSVSSSGSFDVGAAIIGKADVELNNMDGRFSDYDFTGAKMSIDLGYDTETGTTVDAGSISLDKTYEPSSSEEHTYQTLPYNKDDYGEGKSSFTHKYDGAGSVSFSIDSISFETDGVADGNSFNAKDWLSLSVSDANRHGVSLTDGSGNTVVGNHAGSMATPITGTASGDTVVFYLIHFTHSYGLVYQTEPITLKMTVSGTITYVKDGAETFEPFSHTCSYRTTPVNEYTYHYSDLNGDAEGEDRFTFPMPDKARSMTLDIKDPAYYTGCKLLVFTGSTAPTSLDSYYQVLEAKESSLYYRELSGKGSDAEVTTEDPSGLVVMLCRHSYADGYPSNRVKLSGSVSVRYATEWLHKGVYHVQQPDSYGGTIGLELYDNMTMLELPYADAGVTYPATALDALDTICNYCGLTLSTVDISNADYKLTVGPESDGSSTCLDAMGYIAQLTGNFVRATPDGKIEVAWYDTAALEASDGSYPRNVAKLSANKQLTKSTDDVVITGIRVTASDLPEVTDENGNVTQEAKDGETYMSGSEGYILSIPDNPLVAYGQAQAVADMIAARVVGMRFRTFSATTIGDPSVEAGDPALIVDRDGKEYQTYITSYTYKVAMMSDVRCDAATPARNGAAQGSPTTEAIVKLRNEVKRERDARQRAITDLNKTLSESSGLYETDETMADGSTVRYLHDKPTLAESKIVWKFTAESVGVSTDGGKNYDVGLTAAGDAILQRIYAIGINADYLVTGTIKSKNGDTNWNLDSGEFRGNLVAGSTIGGNAIANEAEVRALSAVNADNQKRIFNQLTNGGTTQGIYLQDGRVYINGEYIKSGTIEGRTIKGGTITGAVINNGNGTFSVDTSGNLKAKAGTIAGFTISGQHLMYGTDTSGNRAFMDIYSGGSIQIAPSSLDHVKLGYSGLTLLGPKDSSGAMSVRGGLNFSNGSVSLQADGATVDTLYAKNIMSVGGKKTLSQGSVTTAYIPTAIDGSGRVTTYTQCYIRSGVLCTG